MFSRLDYFLNDGAQGEESENSSRAFELRENTSDDHALTTLSLKQAVQMSIGQSSQRPPRAETGMIEAIHVSADGAEQNEAQDASRTTAETRPVPLPDRAKLTDAKALIIEDTPDLADLLEVTLTRLGLQVMVARRGSHALTHIEEAMPDVILLDIHLPDMTGWKVLEALKEKRGLPGAKHPAVIVITAYGDAANRLVGKLQGVHQYLVKPLKPEEVEEVVQRALGAVR
ncbi:MAG: response regulator receiver modulated diguanylate cyclase [Chloroflexi bacterium OLB15]|nr:MAG: response regulator receiver modulated diguanylate cyclase [Chloroflexi bacterium OLB15]